MISGSSRPRGGEGQDGASPPPHLESACCVTLRGPWSLLGLTLPPKEDASLPQTREISGAPIPKKSWWGENTAPVQRRRPWQAPPPVAMAPAVHSLQALPAHRGAPSLPRPSLCVPKPRPWDLLTSKRPGKREPLVECRLQSAGVRLRRNRSPRPVRSR